MLDLADLPPAIVSALQTFAERLAQHIRTHPEASLAAHEQGVLDAWRASAPAVLEGTLQATTAGLDPRVRPLRARCPQCGTARPFLDQRGRALQTRVGPIGFTRPWYHCPPCHRGWSPSDRTLGIGAYERASAGVRRWAAELGAAHTFAEAQARLADLAGVSLGQETVRTYAEAVGAQVEAAQQAAITHVLDEQEPLPETTDPAPGDLVVETDGVYVRYREPGGGVAFHEVKLGLVAGCYPGNGRPTSDRAHRPPVLRQPSYVAARETAAQFGPRLLAEAARRGALDVVGWTQPPSVDPRLAGPSGPALAVLRRVQVLGDGAVWIWHLADESFGSERIDVVDWYHSSKHRWDLATALHGEGTPTARAWAEQAQPRLWRHGPAPLLALLQATTPATPEAAEALRIERGFFTTNAARMAYPHCRRLGLPIGSGASESGAKHLVQHRFCRAGMRWSQAGATALLTLRMHLLSGRSLAPTDQAA